MGPQDYVKHAIFGSPGGVSGSCQRSLLLTECLRATIHGGERGRQNPLACVFEVPSLKLTVMLDT